MGHCPAGGQHDLSGSGNYILMSEGDAQSQQQGNLILRRLECHKTTEHGHDEVYYLVGGRDGVGHQFSKRGPNEAEGADADDGTAWDLNDEDGNKKNRYLNATVLHFALSPGQSLEASLALMESDGTSYGATLAAAAKMAATVADNPYVTVAAMIAGVLAQFIPKNQDDHLGSVFFRVRNDQGERQKVGGDATTIDILQIAPRASGAHFTVTDARPGRLDPRLLDALMKRVQCPLLSEKLR